MNMIFKFIKCTDVRILILCLAAMFFLSLSAGAQNSNCTMVCKGQVNATLDPETCLAVLTPEDLTNASCPGDYLIEIISSSNFVLASGVNELEVDLVGDYIFKVTNNGIPCWGNISFEDKSGPFKNLSGDSEPPTEVCGVVMEDPSGIVDLEPELVSCVVLESGYSIEPWFDVLEVSDFKDCSGIDGIHNFTSVVRACELEEQESYFYGIPFGWEANEVYTRGWYAVDIDGNYSDTCYQKVVTIKPSADLILLEDHIVENCDEATGASGPSFTDVENDTDFLTCPETAGKEIIMTEGLYCGYIIAKSCSPKVPICDADVENVYKEICKWTVADWCTGEKRYDQQVQVYEVKDDIAPIVFQGAVDFYAAPFDCAAELVVGPASFDEEFECTTVVSWTTIVEYGNISYEGGYFEKEEVEANGISLSDIPSSAEVKVTWLAMDACGNVGEKTVMFSPMDSNAPVCIANDELNVGLIINDPVAHTLAARVYAEDLDDSSYDNCQDIKLYVRRVDEKLALVADNIDPAILWAPYVEFSDEDLVDGACEASYKVELLITEDRPGGLSTICFSVVTIENKTAPIAKAPEDIYAKCTDHYPTFGEVEIWGACNSDFEVETETLIDDDCAYDVIYHARRTWTPFTIVDGSKHYGLPVSQSIWVKNVHDVKIEFPLDMEVDCNVDGTIPDALTIEDLLTDDGCGKWQMDVEDKYYSSIDEADCKKIIREYTFTNWCTWEYNRTEQAIVNRPDELILEDGEQVIWSYKDDKLNYRNDIDDLNDGDPYDQFKVGVGAGRDGAFVLIDNGDRPAGVQRYEGNDGINGRKVTYVDGYRYGQFTYRQIIKITDSTAPELTGGIDDVVCDPTSTSCELYTDVTASFAATDNCSNVDLSYQLLVDGSDEPINDPYGSFDGTTISGRYPAGTHAFVVTARDGCNNVTAKSYDFTVGAECKKPTPVALATFTAVMENGNVEVWLSDVESGSSYDNCTSYDDLKFGIEVVIDLDGNGIISSADVSDVMPSAQVLYLDCSNIGKVIAAIWIRDQAGNTQYTLAPIYITDNNSSCDGVIAEMANVSGTITNESDEEIDQVMIKLNGSGMNNQASLVDGIFNFDVPMNRNVTIAPEKSDNYLNGISTSDLVILQRHILGINELNTAYNLIAADANNDQKVNTRDMLQISQLILGLTTELPNNSSWRFVDKSYQFANPSSPWGFSEAIDLNNLSADEKADFIGIKIGDVSGNARASNLLGNDAKLGTKKIAINDQVLSTGTVSEIEFKASDFNDIAGYQFTLKLDDAVEILEVVPGVLPNLNASNFGLNQVKKGIITTSWASAQGIDLADNEVLFTIRLSARETVNVSEVLSINSSVTAAESYDNDLNTYNLEAKFIRTSGAELVLHQNTPNPFNGSTTIGFDLPEAGAATLKVMDIAGKTLKVVTSDYQKGYNQVVLSSDDLNVAGVLYYELTSKNTSLTKKMVVLK